ncbi:MAG: type II toxin-antitoxin system VapB family antitoxin [Pseudomonadota bacterium]
MGISIKNEEVERLIRTLASKTGESVTDAVRHAVMDRLDLLDRVPAAVEAQRLEKLDKLIAEFRRLPVKDDRDHGEMLYDKDGLPK